MKKLNIKNLKIKLAKKNLGMSYVELIVVLAIFSVMTGVIMFNYRDFNSQVAVKSLSNDVALKVVEAQKVAMSGKLLDPELQDYQSSIGVKNWKPAYGLFFSMKDTNNFVYFTDLENSSVSNDSVFKELRANQAIDFSGVNTCDHECLDTIKINQNYQIASIVAYCGPISKIEKSSLQAAAATEAGTEVTPIDAGEDTGAIVGGDTEIQPTIEEFANDIKDTGGTTGTGGTEAASKQKVEQLTVTFTRPDSRADIRVGGPNVSCKISAATINLVSGSARSSITVYPSGRIQIK